MRETEPGLDVDRVSGHMLPRTDRLTRVAGVLKWLLVAAAVWYIGSYLAVALARIGYPFELEWMEGAVADHVRRILSGKALYVSPSLEFVPFIYAPLYFYVSAGLAKVIGFSLLPLRLVSFVSSLACFALIYAFVRRETGSRFYGLIAAGLFAATFRAAGAWLDIARADSLFLALLLAGMYLARFGRSMIALAAAGALFALSFHTKQTALFVVLPVMLGLLIMRRLRALAFVGAFGVLAGGAVPVLNSLYHGWYYYYVFDLPAHGTLLKLPLWQFWTRDLLWTVPVACVLAVVLLARRRADLERGVRLFYILALAGMVAAAWSGRVHRGGYDNALLPAYAGLAILSVLGAWTLVRQPEATAAQHRVAAAVVFLACIAQFGRLWYNPAAQIPSLQDKQAGTNLVAALARFPGDVFMPKHGYLPGLAGKEPFVHQMAFTDVLSADPSETATRLFREVAAAIAQRRFSAIILDGPSDLDAVVRDEYVPQTPVFSSENVFWPRTGMRTRPEWIFVPPTDTQTTPHAPRTPRLPYHSTQPQPDTADK